MEYHPKNSQSLYWLPGKLHLKFDRYLGDSKIAVRIDCSKSDLHSASFCQPTSMGTGCFLGVFHRGRSRATFGTLPRGVRSVFLGVFACQSGRILVLGTIRWTFSKILSTSPAVKLSTGHAVKLSNSQAVNLSLS